MTTAVSSSNAVLNGFSLEEPKKQEVSSCSQKRLRVVFANEKSAMYDMAALKEFGFFECLEGQRYKENEERCLPLPKVQQEHFQVIYALVYQKKPVCEVVCDHLLQSKDFFEELLATLHFFHPLDEIQVDLHELYKTDPKMAAEVKKDQEKALEVKKVVEKLRSSLPHLMTLKTAEKIVTMHFAELGQPLSAALTDSFLSLAQAAVKEPYLVTVAKSKILQSRTLLSVGEAEERFAAICDQQVAMELAQNHKEKLEASLARLPTSSHRSRLELPIQRQQNIIQDCQKSIEALVKELPKEGKLSKFPLIKQQKLAASIHDKDPFMQAVAIACKKEVDAHRELVLAVLKKKGADLSRQDLLEYIIGPKAFLFDHYGLEAFFSTSQEGFKKGNVDRYEYNLENPSVFDLENEIREDVAKHGPLPTRITRDRVVTKPVSSQAQALREKIITLWEEAHKNAELRDAIKRELIQLFRWDEKTVLPESISLVVEQGLVADTIRVVVKETKRQVRLEIEDISTLHPVGNPNSSAIEKMPSFIKIKEDKRGFYSSGLLYGNSNDQFRRTIDKQYMAGNGFFFNL